MNSRKLADHTRAVKYIQKLSEAINNPTQDKLRGMIETVMYLQAELKHNIPGVSKAVSFPAINYNYLKGFVATTEFNAKQFVQEAGKVNDARSIVKQYAITSDPYSAIESMLKAPVLRVWHDDQKKAWTKIVTTDHKKKLEEIRVQLDALNSRAAKEALKYLPVIILVIGTILMNYILCAVALGMVAAEMSLEKYYKNESLDPHSDGIFDTKNYPYILSGSYPLLHVDRSKSYKEVITSSNNAYDANNLIDLIKKLHMYTDNILLADASIETRGGLDIRTEVERGLPFNYFDRHGVTWRMENDEHIFAIKNLLMEVSRACVDYDFRMTLAMQYAWCEKMLNRIEQFCRMAEMFQRDHLLPIGDVVMMFETLCLQLWDGFLRCNEIKKTVNHNNEYLKVDATDDTFRSILYYNMIPPVNPTRLTTNSAALMKTILESAGASTKFIAEAEEMKQANQPDAAQQMKVTADSFTKAMGTAKDGAKQMSTKALAWCTQNANNVKNLGQYFTAEDSVTMKNYTFNVANVRSAAQLLNDIETFVRDEYIKNRQSGIGNINRVIAKSFPALKIEEGGAAFPPARLANLIATGNAETETKEVQLNGQQLQTAYGTMFGMLTDAATVDYFKSDIFDRLQRAVAGFATATKNANVRPDTGTPNQQAQGQNNQQPKNESLMAEAETAPPPNTATSNPPSGANKPQTMGQHQQGTGAKTPENKPPVTNATESNDKDVLTHATQTAVAVIGTLQSMANDAYSVIAAYYSVLKNRSAQNQQPAQQS